MLSLSLSLSLSLETGALEVDPVDDPPAGAELEGAELEGAELEEPVPVAEPDPDGVDGADTELGAVAPAPVAPPHPVSCVAVEISNTHANRQPLPGNLAASRIDFDSFILLTTPLRMRHFPAA